MTEFRADIHCHSNCSDGSASPVELVRLAHQMGLSGLSITDHDTVQAYKSAIPEAEKLQIKLLPGVEFSAVHRDISIHVLAYAFHLDNRWINEFCARHQTRRTERNLAILEMLSKHGMPISEDELHRAAQLINNPHRTVGRPHIALAMVAKKYVNSVQDAFKKYLGEGKMCYVPGKHFTVEETLDIIHAANALAVIAHPHLIEKLGTVKDLLEMEFDGMEVYYAKFDANTNQRWVRMAQEHELLMTGGSDFHGEIRPHIPLGAAWVNEEAFNKLYQHYQTNLNG